MCKSIYILKVVYSKHYTLRYNAKKNPLDKINGTKNVLFFLLEAPAHHSFTFNSQFLYELKHNVCLSKTVCGIFHFQFRSAFVKVNIFVQQNALTL